MPTQVSVAPQQRPQPHSVCPRPQMGAHTPATHTCPHEHPVGHDAGAHWYCSGVAGFELRLQVLPLGHVPAQ